ncbi:HMG-box domain, partial [Rhizoctonia solani]
MAHPQMHRTKPPPVEIGHIANQINAMPVAPAAEAQKREIVAKLNDLAAQMKTWAAQVEGFASHLNALPVQHQKYPQSPPEMQYSSRGAPANGQSYNTYIAQQYGGSSQYQFQTQQHYSQPGRLESADYVGAQLSKTSPVPLGPGSATPTLDELEKSGKRRRRTDSTRKKKDPLAPKRPPSAYILYQNDVRKQMQDKYPDLSYSDVLGKISESWQALEESKKKVYLDMVERDKLRYEDEKLRYNAGQDIPARPVPRRPLSSLRVPSEPDPDADAEVEPEPEGDEEEEPEEEQEEQGQPDAKRSKFGNTYEVQPAQPIVQSPESQPLRAPNEPEHSQPEHSSHAPISLPSQQVHQVAFPQLTPQLSHLQHVIPPQPSGYASTAPSIQPHPSPQVGYTPSPAAHTTPTPQPQGTLSSSQDARTTTPQIAHANLPVTHNSPNISQASPSPHQTHASPQVAHASPNSIPHITHPSPRYVHASLQQAPVQPQPRNPNAISMMQIPHLTQVPPPGVNSPDAPVA